MKPISNFFKNKTVFLLLLIPFFSNAIDRIVEENGAGGAYTSIKAALVGISTNTRILVFPRSGDNPYTETDTVSVAGTRILCAIPGERFRIKGGFYVSGASVRISAAIVEGNVIYAGDLLNVAGCTIYGSILPASIITSTSKSIFVDNDSIIVSAASGQNSAIKLYRGRVSGCYIQSANNTRYVVSVQNSGVAGNDTVFIVGNHIRATNEYVAISFVTESQFGCITNNYIEASGCTTGISLFGKASPSVRNVCNNNSIRESTLVVNDFVAIHHTQNTVAFDILNNVYFTPNINGNSFFYNMNVSPFVVFRYNYSSTAFKNGSFAADGTNNLNSNTTINTLTGQLLLGSDAIDGGTPGNTYLDLDLTRNNAGCYGGSYSRANFTTAETGARVLFMRAPSTVMANTPFRIEAEGIHK